MTGIVDAEYLISPLMPVDPNLHPHAFQNGNPMYAWDGAWGSTDEVGEAINDTWFLPLGTYTIYVHVRGSNGAVSAFKTCSLEVLPSTTDTTGPVATATGFIPDNQLGPGEFIVTLNATFDDTADPGTATIAFPEYWISGCGLGISPGTPMTIVSPGGEIAEARSAPIDTTGWIDGPRLFYVAAKDSLGNQGGCYRADLFIVRTSPGEPVGPICSNVQVNPAALLSQPGQSTTLTATCDDSTTGGNNVWTAEFFIDPDPATGLPNPGPYANATGTVMYVQDGLFDEVQENVQYQITDVYAPPLATWPVGTYALRVHAEDVLGSWGILTNTTLTILATGPSDLTITLQGNDLRLDWTAAGMAGLDHYNVYRASNDVSGFTFNPASRYDTAPAGATSWIDPAANEAFDANQYFYVVRASDAPGNEDTNTMKVGKVPVDLVAGANLVSIPLQLQDTRTDIVFNHLVPVYTSVAQFDPATGWTFFNTTGPQDLLTLDYTRGIRVQVSQSVRFITVGAVPSVTAISLSPGWNFVAYNRLRVDPVPAVLDSNGLTGMYSAAAVYAPLNPYDHWAQYRPADPAFQDLLDLRPGYGVWIQATSAATWTLAGE